MTRALPQAHAEGHTVTVVTRSVRATEALAARLARALSAPATLLLDGDLGAGKTTFTRGFVRALPGGARVTVQSPTFALARTYATTPPVHHLDLYRLADDASFEDAVEALGLGELVDDRAAFTLVEWPRALAQGERTVRVSIETDAHDDDVRRVVVTLPPAFAGARIEPRATRATRAR